MRDDLQALGVEFVSAHLPFKGIHDGRDRSSEWSRVAEAFGILGGGFALCVQAVLVATDAGAVQSGERVAVAAADTAFAAIACRTDAFLSPIDGILIEHIICRPQRYTISKPAHQRLAQMWRPEIEVREAQVDLGAKPPRALTPASRSPDQARAKTPALKGPPRRPKPKG
jgi:hypothetical protein